MNEERTRTCLRQVRGHISTRTVIRRLHHQWMRARRPIKRPQLTLCHRLCSIWVVTWSFVMDYSHMETGPVVWWKSFFATPFRRSCKDLAPTKHIISGQPHFGTTAFGGGGVTVWGCFSFDCKLDLYVPDGNLTGQKYRDNVLAPCVVPHFDNHALADRPMFMDDNARPHRARIVQYFLQQEAVQTFHGLRCRQTWTL